MAIKRSRFDTTDALDPRSVTREGIVNPANPFQASDVVDWQEWPGTGRRRAYGASSQSEDREPVLGKLAYSIPEAGRLLGLCRASVYNLIAQGEIATVNLSRRAPRILREELVAFLQRKVAAAEAMDESVRMTMGRR